MDDDNDLLSMNHSMEDDKGDDGGEINEINIMNQIKTQYITRTMRLLRFIQLLTEGHHSELQDFLREQKHFNGVTNQKTFDFVTYVANMLQIYEKQYINCYTCSLGM